MFKLQSQWFILCVGTKPFCNVYDQLEDPMFSAQPTRARGQVRVTITCPRAPVAQPFS